MTAKITDGSTPYSRWKAKPGNVEAKRQAMAEAYAYRKSLGLCPMAGCQEAPAPNQSLCKKHAR